MRKGCVEGAFSEKINNTQTSSPLAAGMVWCSLTVKEVDMKRFSLLILGGLFLITSILGCNAARGVGTDIKNAGGHIENIGK